ncbi:MAG: hypothetical protein ACR2H4_11335 [Pyrinomonadaceae bacterium]
MKLCSQCEFIYEDDQECCDMDGAALVYEPTLESVFQTALEAKSKLERPLPAKLTGPLSTAPRPETSTMSRNVFATRGSFALQIAACLVLAVIAFAAFYFAPRPFQTKAQTSAKAVETRKLATSSAEGELPTLNAVVPAERPETPNSNPETSSLSDKPQTPPLKLEASLPALPGVKPLPRLKPLPTLKPLPRLQDQNRSLRASRKAAVVKEKANAKKDSRFGSFLKKTGRILKKPFKS